MPLLVAIGLDETKARQVLLRQCDAGQGETLGKRKKRADSTSTQIDVVPKPFAGTWDTEMLPVGAFSVTFTQQGNRVTGQFINGSLEGTLQGNDVLDFTVTFQSSVKGVGRLTLTPDGKQFGGRFNLESDLGTVRMWNGKRR